MRSHRLLSFALAAAATFGAGVGCAGAEVGAEINYPSTAVGTIQIEPGVWVVDNAGVPTYFADNVYWCFDGGLWYRRPRWGGPWLRVDVGRVPGRVVHRDHHPYRVYAYNRGLHGGSRGVVGRAPHGPRGPHRR
jgi:hypothetical protein